MNELIVELSFSSSYPSFSFFATPWDLSFIHFHSSPFFVLLFLQSSQKRPSDRRRIRRSSTKRSHENIFLPIFFFHFLLPHLSQFSAVIHVNEHHQYTLMSPSPVISLTFLSPSFSSFSVFTLPLFVLWIRSYSNSRRTMLTDRLITRIGSLRGLSPLRMGSFGSVSSAPPGSAKIPAFQVRKIVVVWKCCDVRECWGRIRNYENVEFISEYQGFSFWNLRNLCTL